MTGPRYQLTTEIRRDACQYIQAGGNPDDAAEAAGVPRDVFARWLRTGENPRAAAKYRDLADAVRSARGQARVHNQIRVYDRHPLQWFRDDRERDRQERKKSNTTPLYRPDSGEPDPGVEAVRAVLETAGFALAGHPEALAILRCELAPELPARGEVPEELDPDDPPGDEETEADEVQQDDSEPAADPQSIDDETTAGAGPRAAREAPEGAPDAQAGDELSTAEPRPAHSGPAENPRPVEAECTVGGDFYYPDEAEDEE